MPLVFLTISALVGAAGLAIAGWYFVSYLRKPAATALVPPDQTTDRSMAYRHAIRLAIEMCRADGILKEEEMNALDAFFARECGDLGPEFVQNETRAALKATIRRDATASSVTWLGTHADRDDQSKILVFLAEIARSDGAFTERERAFFRYVGTAWGQASEAMEAHLT